MASRRHLRLRFNSGCIAIAATLGCYLTCVSLMAGTLHALDPNKRITQYMHTAWRKSDGSAPSGAYAMTQTSDGFLWLVSGDMYRFDGVRFLLRGVPGGGASFSAKDNVFGQIVNAFGDRWGGLWVLGKREIVHLKGGVITASYPLTGLLHRQNISEAPDGSLWVVRGTNRIADGLPLCHITAGSVRCFGKADSIPISPITSILADGDGGFWLGGQTAVVHWRSGVSEMYAIKGLQSNVGQQGIWSLARAPDGAIWVGTLPTGPGRGLGRLVNGVFQPFVTKDFDGSKLPVIRILFDRDGNLWVGTFGKGIFRIHGDVVDHYGRTEGLSSDTVNDLFLDREGILWAGTTEGIDNFHDPLVASFSSVEGLGNDVAHGVLASRDGTVWIANTGSLDHIANGTVSSIRTEASLQVTTMLEDRAGNLWVGVGNRLYLFKDGHFQQLPEPDHQPLGTVYGLTEDTDGNIWAECFGNPPKLVRIRNFQVQQEFTASQVPAGYRLAADPRGGIWIQTFEAGLALFRNGVVQNFPITATKGDPISHQLIANGDGSVLAGSANGLVGLRNGKVQRMTTKNGLPCNFVTSFIQDEEKHWWLMTDCGIVELSDAEMQRWWANPEAAVQIRFYDELDGARAGRPAFNSAALSSDGRVWFPGGIVVQMLDPARLSQKALPAETYIDTVTVDRKEFPATNNLRLSPHPRELQFDYTSSSYLIPKRVQFRYRLLPYDRDWHEAGIRRQAF